MPCKPRAAGTAASFQLRASRRVQGDGGERSVTMNDVSIKVRENGPYLVKGPFTLTDADGSIYRVEAESVALCRCGASQTKPFCDASHRTNGFAATERCPVLTENL